MANMTLGRSKSGELHVFCKLDYYDRDMDGGSEDPTDPTRLIRYAATLSHHFSISACQVERDPPVFWLEPHLGDTRTCYGYLWFVCVAKRLKISSFTRLHFGAYTAKASASGGAL